MIARILSNTSLDFINHGNTVLMLLSVVLAFLFPFELFLFSFIVLGPLHYLTELLWLQKKNFFTPTKTDAYIIAITGIVITAIILMSMKNLTFWLTLLFSAVFVFAFILVFTKKTWLNILITTLVIFIAYQLKFFEIKWYAIVITIFLTTVIHTTIFTFLFIVSGVRKQYTFSGMLSLVMFLVCSVLFFVVPLPFDFYQVGALAKEKFGFFVIVNKSISDLSHFGHFTKLDDVFYSKEGIAIMRFIAFAYTYHYLNWFSKTSIIKWHDVPKIRLAAVVLAWIGLTGLYMYDMKIGILTIYLIALWHTLLEFPLNHLALVGIFKPKVS